MVEIPSWLRLFHKLFSEGYFSQLVDFKLSSGGSLLMPIHAYKSEDWSKAITMITAWKTSFNYH